MRYVQQAGLFSTVATVSGTISLQCVAVRPSLRCPMLLSRSTPLSLSRGRRRSMIRTWVVTLLALGPFWLTASAATDQPKDLQKPTGAIEEKHLADLVRALGN